MVKKRILHRRNVNTIKRVDENRNEHRKSSEVSVVIQVLNYKFITKY